MTCLARVEVPGTHHVIQPGDRREAIFLEDGALESLINQLATTQA